jgi:parallel beta-helix repeat protein
MNPTTRTCLVAAIAGTLGVAAVLTAGPLTPPAGAPTGTYKTLSDIEPRRAVQSLPGNATAQYVISEPGSYYLTGPINGVPGKAGIEVSASNVTIDLRGQTISGAGTDGIGVPTPRVNVEVYGGTIDRCGGAGIFADVVTGGAFRNLRLTRNTGPGLVAGPMSVVELCQASANQAEGILAGDRVVIAGCVASGNTGTGIWAGLTSQVTRCTSSGNQNGFVLSHNSTVSDCSAVDSTNNGFRLLNTTTITNCSAATNGTAGFYAEVGNTITNCTANGNTWQGFRVGEGNRIAGCNANQNGRDGINAGDACVIVDNNCVWNGRSAPGAGIHLVSSRNRVEGNTLTLNPVAVAADVGLNTIVRNYLSANTTDFTLAPGNALGTVLTVNATFSSSEPWANLKQ